MLMVFIDISNVAFQAASAAVNARVAEASGPRT
jgi:hypothetical protein